ncbi:MAG: hypothetical protein OQK55_08185 [Thermoanaerobaculales bacterium]|nr:hypothetical protein [Thermoanaerobaculales bacterium]
MKRFLTMALAGVLALGLGSAAYAVECALDNVPASTLLFPFVTYDYETGFIGGTDNSGQTTLFAITNVSADAQIVHITLWSDYSVALLDFNLTLTGYDVQTINIRDILRDGVLPSDDTGANEWWDGTGTTNAGPPPFDDGPYSTRNELWAGALDPWFWTSPGVPNNGLPVPISTNPLDCDPTTWISSPVNYREDPNGDGDLSDSGIIPADFLDVIQGHLQVSELATTGYVNCDWSATEDGFNDEPWFTAQYFPSQPDLPRYTWMYITADVVGACNKDLPDSDALNYFGAASGVQVANVLMGDILYLDSGNNFSEAINAVHIEDLPNPSPISFYYRYHGGTSAENREPLPTAWAFRYMYSATAQANTFVRAWKGSTLSGIVVDLDDTVTGPGGTISGAGPAALYANTCIPYTYYAWDEDENVNGVQPGFIPPWSGSEDPDPEPVANLFPLETQEVPITEFFIVQQNATTAFGWMMVIWPLSNWNGTNPLIDDYDWYQTYMSVKYASFGTYTAGLEAAVMGNYNCNGDSLPGLAIGRYGYSE